MTKSAQLWSGDRMRAFFRAHVRRETSLDDAAADRLSEALTRAVNRMLVFDASIADTMQPSQRAVGKRSQNEKAEVQPSTAKPQKLTAPAATDTRFDPYAFSAMVTLVKFGREALIKRLADITTAEHLRALADAQHLAIADKLKKPEELRKAIVTATEQRLADRKAAAS